MEVAIDFSLFCFVLCFCIMEEVMASYREIVCEEMEGN